MKFFIDTANLSQIQEAQDLGVLDGVTTNPSLMAKEGITGKAAILQHYKNICTIVEGDVSAEVIATDFEGIVREGEELAALHPQIVVKVPMIKDGIKAIKYFTDKGIRTNCTLVFSAGQPKQVLLMYHLSLADLMTFQPTDSHLSKRYASSTTTITLRHKSLQLLCATLCTSSSVLK